MANAGSRKVQTRLSKPIQLLVIAGLIASILASAGPAQARIDGGVLFGAAVGPSRRSGLVETEALLGRQLDLVRVFESWDGHSPKAYWSDVTNGDRTMLISVRAKRQNGSRVNWRQIADAQPGSQLHNEMVAWAKSLRDLDGDIWFTFQHEPEITENLNNGNSADFKAAWRKFASIMRNNGANVKFTWIMSSWSYQVNTSDRRSAGKWYPGDDVVDYIGADPYNWSNCRENAPIVNRSLEETAEAFRQFGLAHPDKGLVLGEWASTDYRNQGTKAGWINDVRSLFKTDAWSQLAAISYYNAHDPKFPRCTWEIDSSPSALQAIKNMAHDPFYNTKANPAQQPPAPQAPAPPPPAPGDTFGPRQSIKTGQLNVTNSPHPRWISTTFKASKTGTHKFKLWSDGGTLDADVRQMDYSWLAVLGSDKQELVQLVAGQTYRIAIWAKAGNGTFEINVYAPAG